MALPLLRRQSIPREMYIQLVFAPGFFYVREHNNADSAHSAGGFQLSG
jgi:hypothetical protein